MHQVPPYFLCHARNTHPFSLYLTSTLYNQASTGCFNLQTPLFRIWCGQVAIKNHWLLLCRTGFLAVKPNMLVSTGRVENWRALNPSHLSACHVVKSKLIPTRTSPNASNTYDAHTMIQTIAMYSNVGCWWIQYSPDRLCQNFERKLYHQHLEDGRDDEFLNFQVFARSLTKECLKYQWCKFSPPSPASSTKLVPFFLLPSSKSKSTSFPTPQHDHKATIKATWTNLAHKLPTCDIACRLQEVRVPCHQLCISQEFLGGKTRN